MEVTQRPDKMDVVSDNKAASQPPQQQQQNNFKENVQRYLHPSPGTVPIDVQVLQGKNLTPLFPSSLVDTLCNSLQAVAIHFVKTLTVLVVCPHLLSSHSCSTQSISFLLFHFNGIGQLIATDAIQ